MTALALAFASRVDAYAHGEHRVPPAHDPRFARRVTADGSSGFPAEAGRYHLYVARTSSAAHRIEIIRRLAGLEDDVTLSHVDPLRDGRGWAFRERTGPDPVNGFTLLREAYRATCPDFAGAPRVPLMWDRGTGQVVSDVGTAIGVDLLTQFAGGGRSDGLYPVQLAGEIERVSSAVDAALTDVLAVAVRDPGAAADVRATLRRIDRHLGERPYLLGEQLTDADVRLWVTLVRYDAGPNAHGTIGPALTGYPQLWRWAEGLYARPQFAATTDFASFAAPFAVLPPWPVAS